MSDKPTLGLLCSKCGGRRWRTTHTRPTAGNRIRRYRRCRDCGRRMVTYEVTSGQLRREPLPDVATTPPP